MDNKLLGVIIIGFGLLVLFSEQEYSWIVSALAVSLTYLVEIDSVCLIDLMSGERARIMAETLKAEIEFAETMGLPKPDTVEDPKEKTETLTDSVSKMEGIANALGCMFAPETCGKNK